MKVYFKTILMLIKTELEYRKAFIIAVLGSFFVTFALTMSLYFLFEEFNQIGDWTYYEVAFLFGMVFLNFSISEMFLRGLDHFDNVIKTTCFLNDIGDFTQFNEVYAKYFTNKPARSCVEVSALPKGVLVEVEVIAEK